MYRPRVLTWGGGGGGGGLKLLISLALRTEATISSGPAVPPPLAKVYLDFNIMSTAQRTTGMRERQRQRETDRKRTFTRVIDKHVCFFTSSPRSDKGLL